MLVTQIKPTTLNLEKISGSVIKTNKTINLTNQSILKVTKDIRKNDVERDKLLRQKSEYTKRQLEFEERQDKEAQLEASEFPSIRPQQTKVPLQTGTGGNFFGRILGFFGYLAAGWAIKNLPTWIAIGKDLTNRLFSLQTNIATFLYDLYNPNKNPPGLLQNFTTGIANTLQNVLTFNFGNIPKDVELTTKGLSENITSMGESIKDSLRLITTPLQIVPETTTDETGGGESSTTTVTDGRVYESTGGRKITRAEFGNRGFRTRDGLGSGATAFGHTGRDVGMPEGTPLSIVSPGVVVETSTGYNGGYGNFVVIKLNDGRYIKLNHLSRILVRTGDKVGPGTSNDGGVRVVGLVGSTGLSTGPHMHLDLGTGYNRGSGAITGLMDPDSFILGGGVVRGGNVKSSGQVTQTSPTVQPQQSLTGQPTPKGGTLSTAQLVSLAKQVGMTKQVNVRGYSGPLDVLMAAVAMQESRGRSTAMRTDTQVYGLWQIRWPVHAPNLRKIGITSPEQLYDPLTNAKAAKMIYDSSGISAWSAFTDGNYKQFLPAARQAAGVAPGQFTTAQRQSRVPGAITPERNPVDIIIPETPVSQQSMPMLSGGQSPMMILPKVNEYTVLNRFIKNKLLLDLAYN